MGSIWRHVARASALVAAVGVASGSAVVADAPAAPGAAARGYDGPHVVLKGGVVLPGRVVGTVTLGGLPFTRIESHFGHVLARPGDVISRDEAAPTGGVFHVSEVRLEERKWVTEGQTGMDSWANGFPEVADPGGSAFETVARRLERGVPLRLSPGMRLRGGFYEKMLRLHRGAQVLMNGAEVTILAPDRDATLALDKGGLSVRISAALRDGSIYVRTPSVRIELAGPGDYGLSVGDRASMLLVHQGSAQIDGRLGVPERTGATWREGGKPVELVPLPEPNLVHGGFSFRDPFPPLEDDMCFVPAGRYRLGASPPAAKTGGAVAPAPYVFGYARAGEADVGAFLVDRREVSARDAKHFEKMTQQARAALARHPARDLTQREAAEWAAKAGKRLPTASQWEVAGRGDAASPLPSAIDATDGGTWTGEEGGDVAPVQDDGRIRWSPPATPAAVDAPTADVSPFGVEALRSGVPELVRTSLQGDPVFDLLRRRRQADLLAGRTEYVRGIRGSLVALASYSRSLSPGFRCVIELTPP